MASYASYATLGGTEDTVEKDRASMAGRHTLEAHKNFTVHEISNASGTVKEYVSPTGVVYGVAWRGMSQPDLSVLFGSYYSEFHDANQKTPTTKGRGHRNVASQNVKVIMSGHMRDVRGVAYIPQLLPAGVTAQDIQW